MLAEIQKGAAFDKDQRRFERALGIFQESGVVAVVKGIASEIPDAEVMVFEEYRPPEFLSQGAAPNPAVILRGPVSTGTVLRGDRSRQGYVQRDVYVTVGDDGSFTMHRWTSSWTDNDKKDSGWIRSESVPFDLQKPGQVLQQALRGYPISPRP